MTAFAALLHGILQQQTAGTGPTGDALQFESNTDFLLLETGDYLLLETVSGTLYELEGSTDTYITEAGDDLILE